MNASFVDLSRPISITIFFATFQLACDTNSTHWGAAMIVLPFLVKSSLATTLNSRMSAAAHISLVFASDNTTKLQIQKKLLRSNPKVINFLLKKFPNDQTIAEMDSKILCYFQPAHMTPIQYANVILCKILQSRRGLLWIHSLRHFYPKCRSLRLSQTSKIFSYAPTSQRDRYRL